MITLRVWFALIALASILTGGTLWSAVVRPANAFQFADVSVSVRELLEAFPEPVQPRIDLYGNEIQDAVGDYRIDPLGDTYESHSPDTAVARLGAPVI